MTEQSNQPDQPTIGVMSFAHGHTNGYVAILQSMGATVIGADTDADRARAAGERHGIEIVSDYDALLARRPDGVVIGAENVHHRALTELAAAAGTYVLTEKPLATTMADGRAMIEACEKAGVGLMTAFPVRFTPAIAQVAANVADGRLGTVVAMAGTNPGSCPGGWFADPALSGGGCVVDHTVHVADLMCWMTGAVPKTVFAQTNQLVRPEFGVETGGLISLEFSDGTIGTIDCSWSRVPASSYPTWGGLTLEVIGTDGVMYVDAFGERVSAYGAKPAWLTFGADPNRAMVAEFLAAIREQRMPSPSGLDGLRATAVAIAAYESAARNQAVPVDL